MKKLLFITVLCGLIGQVEASLWTKFTLPARIPYNIATGLGTAISKNKSAQKLGNFLVGKARLKNKLVTYGEKVTVDDYDYRITDQNGNRTYGTKQETVNTGVPPIRDVYHYFMTQHPEWTQRWAGRIRELFLGYVAAKMYYALYKSCKYWYLERKRELAFKQSVELYLTDEKIAEIARITDGLSNGDLQGIINKIKTYARCTPDCIVTAEIVDQAVREYVEKHQAFQNAHKK